ncbi:hypothetical protein FA15DRAFT_668232 [Coprinopsis marcescibilis]|uniref:Uncharacterized protein n=1 Tax=Coprinopsis marcescibilis TaxID=230819 RepID=A0A5C3KYR0_COPMA|nr:hypothetical protein FA15DRAFT_668232 [Coprinopsis marcescibilis]
MPTPATLNVAPSEEEDISRTQLWDQDQSTIVEQRRGSKGKDKERDASEDQGLYADGDTKELIPNSPRSDPAYPPINDTQTESRRVAETLKQWEAAELQRRKAARQSLSSSSPSLVDNVSRRASTLLSGRSRKSNSISNNSSLGAHTAVPTQDSLDTVPMTSIPASPTPSPSRSETEIEPLDDPFNPDEVPLRSPFADPPASPSARRSTSPLTNGSLSPLSQNTFIAKQPPPALPLNLPPPKKPPPRSEPVADNIDAQPTRWWHEWLCGCGEDRNRDHQGGRTNPFE